MHTDITYIYIFLNARYLLCLIVLFALWAQPMELLSLKLFCSHDTVITMQEWEKYYLFCVSFR